MSGKPVARVCDEGIRYVRITPPSDGWVDALQLNSSKTRIPLCEYSTN